VEELLGCSTAIIKNDIPYLEEHAVEVQLPFIQFLFPESAIVPIMIGRSKSRNIRILANALQLTFADVLSGTLFVATTNLSAYQGKTQSEEDASTLLKLIRDGDAPGMVQAISQKKISAHGASCIAVLLSFEKPHLSSRLLQHFGSDAIQKGAKKAIQYAALSLYREE
jgi:AmmeMemoRadiSam system protein B